MSQPQKVKKKFTPEKYRAFRRKCAIASMCDVLAGHVTGQGAADIYDRHPLKGARS